MEPRRPRGTSLLGLSAAGLGLAALVTVGVLRPIAASDPEADVVPVPTAVGGTGPTAEAPSGPDERLTAFWRSDVRGGPLRWDPCAPILFVLNPMGATPGAAADVRTALDLLSQATGMDLIVLGDTDERPHHERGLVERGPTGWRWRPVLVAWAEPGESGLPLTASDRGIALPVAVRAGDAEAFVTGQVVMNAGRRDLVPGFADRSSAVGATLVHEFAHILGLAHVDDPSQMMWSEPGTGPVVLGDGDRAGLRAIGSESGCIPTPSPEAGRGLTSSP